MPEAPQEYKNHTRRDLAFMAALIILILNFGVIVYNAVRIDTVHFEPQSLLWIALAAALVIIGAKARTNALKAQDRIIRLEERLRYTAVLPPVLQAEAAQLSIRQIVALRFASDTELPALIDRALRENLTAKQIKQSIVVWRPDNLRV